ncbi:peroxiredoxin [Inquilinus sp.]|jgi:peroxiredoxin Q/BCP|uniref:peroxiredoxin n=1 Tax=Inquilinus sp. TaxID=1932117 RepID=UPI00378437CE
MSVEIGKPAPDFTLPKAGGGTVTLSALRGRKVIVYFYPKADTSGCTKEACGFNDALPDFEGVDAEIIGISKDPVPALNKFAAKYSLTFTLASAKDDDTVERYGAWVEKSMYGRKYMGIDRSTVLVDEQGIVRGLWRGVRVPGHVEAVLAAAQGKAA